MFKITLLFTVLMITSCDQSRTPITSGAADIPDSELTSTDSGLKYKVEKKGDGGEKPKATSMVTVHYEGKLLNGKIFDSSYKRGQPSSFPLDQVIPGWTEGVQLMDKGSIYIFKIPSELAYGSRGAGSDIPPDSPLIFKIELVDFK